MNSQIIFSGGIGNQMFEYAFLLSLKHKGITANINTCLYKYMTMHNGYVLDRVFGIEDSTFWGNSKAAAIFIRFLVEYKPRFLMHSEYGFGENNIQKYYMKSKLFYFGCWINPLIFSNIKSQVFDSFKFKDIDDRNSILAEEMSIVNSVSIHIRRGDYLKVAQYAVCDDVYYSKAIKYIVEHVDNPVFYVFSDDPLWCEDFIKQFNVSFKVISHNQGAESYKDMYLMTHCKNNIIANSTFSWWGAWLNTYREKIVVCRSLWIKGKSFNPCLAEWVHL